MVMKSILVSVEESETLPSVLTTALLVARRFGSTIEGLCPRSAMGAFVVVEGMSAATSAALESFEIEEQERTRRARELFRGFMQEHGVPWGVPGQAAEAVSAERAMISRMRSEIQMLNREVDLLSSQLASIKTKVDPPKPKPKKEAKPCPKRQPKAKK